MLNIQTDSLAEEMDCSRALDIPNRASLTPLQHPRLTIEALDQKAGDTAQCDKRINVQPILLQAF